MDSKGGVGGVSADRLRPADHLDWHRRVAGVVSALVASLLARQLAVAAFNARSAIPDPDIPFGQSPVMMGDVFLLVLNDTGCCNEAPPF